MAGAMATCRNPLRSHPAQLQHLGLPRHQPHLRPRRVVDMTSRMRVMEGKSGLPVIAFVDDAAWEAWLREHHASARGVWVKFAKQRSGRVTVSKQEAIRTALCWGWIDGQIGAWDDAWFVTRFTERGPRSRWSSINVRHVEELTAQGRIQPSGQAHVDAARADGRWDAAYSSI